jgi:hypothetical protein
MSITKAAIAELFYAGKLREVEGEYIPCNYRIGCLALPFLFVGYLFLLGLVLALAQYLIWQPENLLHVYGTINSLNMTANVGLIGLTVFAVILVFCLFFWLFFNGLPELKLIIQSLKEAQYQKKYARYRYGLLLTSDYLAIRCFSYLQDSHPIRISSKIIKSFAEDPIIFSKTEIVDIFLDCEHLEKKQPIQCLMMHFFDPEGYIQQLRLPTAHLHTCPRMLYAKLQDWLQS